MHRKILCILLASSLVTGCARTSSFYIPGFRIKAVTEMEKLLPSLPVTVSLPVFILTSEEKAGPESVRTLFSELLTQSPIIRQALYAVASASADVMNADAKRGPVLTAEMRFGGTDSSGNELLRRDGAAGFSGGFTIFDNGAGALKETGARWTVAAAVARLRERIEAVAYNLCEAALNRRKTAALLTLADTQVADFESLLRTVRVQVASGISPASDIPEAEARLQRVKASRIVIRAQMEDAETALRRLTGRSSVPIVPVLSGKISGTPEERAELHPSVVAADADIRVAIRAVMAVDAERFGSLSLQFGPSGFIQAFGGGGVMALGGAFIKASIPLFDSGERGSRLRQAVAGLEMAIARRRDGTMAVSASIRNSETSFTAAEDTEKTALREGEAAERLLSGKMVDWKAGIGDLRTVLDARQEKTDSASRAESARWDKRIAEAKVLATSGLLAERLGMREGRKLDMLSREPYQAASGLLGETPFIEVLRGDHR